MSLQIGTVPGGNENRSRLVTMSIDRMRGPEHVFRISTPSGDEIHFVPISEGEMEVAGWRRIGQDEQTNARIALALERLIQLVERGDIDAEDVARAASGHLPELDVVRRRRRRAESAEVAPG